MVFLALKREIMFNDVLEVNGMRRAPGSAHRRIVIAGNVQPWWFGREDYKDVAVFVPELMSSAQAFEQLGPHTLAKVPLFGYPTRDGKGNPVREKVEGIFGITRSDTKKMLPDVAVSDKYQIIQPADALATCDAIVAGEFGGSRAWFETILELAEGRDLAATIRLDRSLSIAGESLQPFLNFYTSHGKGAARWRNGATRQECRNTMMLAMREAAREVAVRHTGNVKEKMAEAARVMRIALGYMTEFETFANELARTPFSKTQYGLLTDALFPLPEDEGRARTNAEKARSGFMTAVSAPNLNNIRMTAWGALNAVSDFNEHTRPIRNGTDDQNVKLERLFRRSFEDVSLVDKAQELILELVR